MRKEKNWQKENETNDFKIILDKKKKRVLFLMTIDGITGYASFEFRSEVLNIAEFLLEAHDHLEDDIGAGDIKH